MREYIRSYQVFLPLYHPATRALFYLGYPLLLIGFNLFLCEFIGSFNIIYFVLPGELICIELFLDYFIFGGIASKDTNRLEYVKTSQKGMGILKHAFRFDVVRRFISILVVIAGYTLGGYLSGMTKEVSLYHMICAVLLCNLILMPGIIITRYFTQLWFNILIYNLQIIITVFIQVILFQSEKHILILLAMMLAYLAIVTVGNKMLMKRAKEGYYDK